MCEQSRAQPAAKRVRRSVSGGKVATHKDRARKRAVKRSTPVQPTRRSTRLKVYITRGERNTCEINLLLLYTISQMKKESV